MSLGNLAGLYQGLSLFGLHTRFFKSPYQSSELQVRYANSSSGLIIGMAIPLLPMNDGTKIPSLAFGTGTVWFKEDSKGPLDTKLVEILKSAIRSGFNHLDCADCYGTEEEVGIAVQQSGVPRDELFITTKVLDNIGDIPYAIDASLGKLQMEYVDLYLIHTPYYTKERSELQRAWKTMEEVKKQGKARSIGVSNFQRNHLEAILEVATIRPATNQLEFHPYLQRANNYSSWMKEQGIIVSAFKGLAPITVGKGGPLDGPLSTIAKNHSVDASTVLLKWHMAQNVVIVTTTNSEDRVKSYLEAANLDLSAEELEQITNIGKQNHYRWWGNQFFESDDRS